MIDHSKVKVGSILTYSLFDNRWKITSIISHRLYDAICVSNSKFPMEWVGKTVKLTCFSGNDWSIESSLEPRVVKIGELV